MVIADVGGRVATSVRRARFDRFVYLARASLILSGHFEPPPWASSRCRPTQRRRSGCRPLFIVAGPSKSLAPRTFALEEASGQSSDLGAGRRSPPQVRRDLWHPDPGASSGQWAVYGDSSVIVEHRFDAIAEVQRYGPSQSAGDDDVASPDALTLQGQLADQPDNTGCWMT